MKKKPKQIADMVPLFSGRSLITLAIGFIVGCVLGLGIWAIIPSLGILGGEMWASNVDIQAVNLGSTYVSVDSLQSRAAYYADKARGFPFLEYLSEELNKQEPEHAHSIVELNRIITVGYNRYSVTPVFNITVRTPTVDETTFLASHIPKVFIDFITAEDNKRQQSSYQNTLDSIKSIEKALLEAEKERVDYQTKIADSDIQNNPTYIALTAKINSLEPELQTRASELTALIVAGDTDNYSIMQEQKYQQILKRAKVISAELSKKQQELKTLEEQRNDINKDAAIITLNAKMEALETELGRYMAGYTETSGDAVLRVKGLAEMIAAGVTSGPAYEDILEKIEVTSTALAEAKKELADLQYQISSDTAGTDLDYQIARAEVESLKAELSDLNGQLAQLVAGSDVETNQEIESAFARTSVVLAEAKNQLAVLKRQMSNDIYEANLGIQITQAKIDNFNRVLSTLNTNLASLAGNTSTSDLTDSIAVGEPTIPAPVLPVSLPSAVLGGIIIGVGGSWLILNFRWLVKVLSSSPEEDTDEAGGG